MPSRRIRDRILLDVIVPNKVLEKAGKRCKLAANGRGRRAVDLALMRSHAITARCSS